MNRVEEWCVENDFAGLRLDQAINQKYHDISRTLAHEMIKAGEILLNDASTKPGQKLKGGETVKLTLRCEEESTAIAATPLDFKILYEDKYIVVVDKPAGLVVHPGAGKEKATVVSALLGHTKLSPVGAPTRPGVVHRLDKETSGIMVLAKTREAHRRLAEAFSGRELEKEYMAIIQGHVVNRKGRIEVAIERDKVHRKRMKATAADKGRMAISLFEVVEYLEGATLIKVKILTGRTHQIRVHMAFTGHPLLGDTTYGGKRWHSRTRHFLHSSRLAFNHPITGVKIDLQAPIPEYFATAISELRRNSGAT
ncbi:MAG: RluA family pseudouridine synthase [Candidatus Riflebacteria bacterium HGW-Riflebacteria-2]|jgi:23S rRNA pseudouridine1911/1915/1917 synthase|nr:MAG: RluA family pseudouridine synthase [Candidatus Riflebacteria bacterium HGW-Riflebacteria-2]